MLRYLQNVALGGLSLRAEGLNMSYGTGGVISDDYGEAEDVR